MQKARWRIWFFVLFCFWGVGWIRERGRKTEESEAIALAFYGLTPLHGSTYLQWRLPKFTRSCWKWISCDNSWRAEFWESIKERGTKTKTASTKIWAKDRDDYGIITHWELTEILIKTLDFIDLRNGGIELSEGQGSFPVESEIIPKDNYLGKVGHYLTQIFKPDSSN